MVMDVFVVILEMIIEIQIILEKDLEDSLTIVDLSCVEDIEEFEEEARKYWDKSKKEKSKNKKV